MPDLLESDLRRSRHLLALDDDRVLTLAEWRKLNGLSERTARRILQSGDGPIITQLSPRRLGITVRNNRLWQKSRERG
jgi:hypothetical protein